MRKLQHLVTVAAVAMAFAGVTAGAELAAFDVAEAVVNRPVIVDQAQVPIQLVANPAKSYSRKWSHGKKHPAGHPNR